MKRFLSVRTLLLAALLPVIAVVAPATSTAPAVAATPPKVLGYTLKVGAGDFQCDLSTIDWDTGAVTDLPAPTSADACAMDLAVAPDGTVYGLNAVSFAMSLADKIYLVKYSADGTGTRIPLVFPAGYSPSNASVNPVSGLAVGADGKIYVMYGMLDVIYETCLPYLAAGSVDENSPESYAASDGAGMTSCLFTADPTTGALTLVGPSRLVSLGSILLSIGSDAMRGWVPGAGPVSIAPAAASGIVWSTVNPTTGEVTPSAIDKGSNIMGFDALRSGPTVYCLTKPDGDTNVWTATVDPKTGTVTPIARTTLAEFDVNIASLAVTEVLVPTPVPEEPVVVPKMAG